MTWLLALTALLPWLVAFPWIAMKDGSLKQMKGAGPLPFIAIWLFGCLSCVLANALRTEGFWVSLVTACVTMIVLADCASEDVATGKFYVLPMIAALLVNVITAVISGGFREANGPFAVSLWKELLLVFVILFVLWLGGKGLAIGDAFLYLACYLSFLTLCRENSFLAFFLTLLASTIFGLFTWLVRVVLKKDPKKRFPYTAQIYFGCVVSYFVFCFLPWIAR